MSESKGSLVVDSDKGIKLEMLSVDSISVNEWNPNEMAAFELNQLAGDVATTGFLQPILVAPLSGGKYRIIDGEHRFEVAKICDMKDVPAIVVSGDAEYGNVDWQKFQTVRMNRLRGKLNRKKFDALIEDLASRHPLNEVAEKLVFEDPSYIENLLESARNTLPTKGMKDEFDKAKDAVKTIDDLTVLLNRIYSRYGETLDYGYMVFDFGGKDHLWVRIGKKKDFLLLKEKADLSRQLGVSFPSVIMRLIERVDEQFLKDNLPLLASVYEGDDEDGF